MSTYNIMFYENKKNIDTFFIEKKNAHLDNMGRLSKKKKKKKITIKCCLSYIHSTA